MEINAPTSEELQDMAHKLRIYSIEMTALSNSGHPTSSSSISELLSVLFFHPSGLHFDPKHPQNANNDKFILSKGHAAPAYYAAWAEAGNFPVSDLNNLRKVDSDLEGHPTPRLNFCDVATGSLGQGLGYTVGAAYASKYWENINNKYFCIMGDGECAEGSVWEAANFAWYYKLDNVIGIVDVNRLGQSEPTSLQHNVELYEQRFAAFGWHTIVIDGHNIDEIISAFTKARSNTGLPTAIICKTFKGKYFIDIEDKLNWHGKALGNSKENVIKHLLTLVKNPNITLNTITKPSFDFSWSSDSLNVNYKIDCSNYDRNKVYSSREGYGFALRKLGEQDKFAKIVSLDCDVKNSTMAETFEKAFPDRFINCFIAEQNMISVALGCSKRNKIPFCSTFATFFSRSFDQIRMAAISFANVKFFGSHSGTCIGQDGPSQMGLEDLTIFRAIPNIVVLYPSDIISTERSVELAANHVGMVYIKGERNQRPILYENDEQFEIGKSKLLRSSDKDCMTIVSGGNVLHEALKVYERLIKEDINVRIVDVFSVKPFDKVLLRKCAEETGKVFVVEDHYAEGGLGGKKYTNIETVMRALRKQKNVEIFHRCVKTIPRSGTEKELYDMYGLSADRLYQKVLKILRKK